MPATASSPMTVEDFLIWQRDQGDRDELVEGVPVKQMTGASTRHDRMDSKV